MAKKNEVVRCVRQQTIATYDVNDGFLVDVVLDVKKQGMPIGYITRIVVSRSVTYRFQRSTRMMMGIPLPILLSPRMLRITLTQRLGKRIRSIIRIITFWYNKGEGLRLEKAWVFFCVRKVAENK